MIIVYTGNGKGKSSACIGQALRAFGHGERVLYAQMMKSDTQSGEQKALLTLLGEDFYIGGAGFFQDETDRPRHAEAAKKTLSWAKEKITKEKIFMLVLDEALYALNKGLVDKESLLHVFETAKERSCHIVLSGRGAPPWLIDLANLVSEIQEIKHPWREGIAAARGIEY